MLTDPLFVMHHCHRHSQLTLSIICGGKVSPESQFTTASHCTVFMYRRYITQRTEFCSYWADSFSADIRNFQTCSCRTENNLLLMTYDRSQLPFDYSKRSIYSLLNHHKMLKVWRKPCGIDFCQPEDYKPWREKSLHKATVPTRRKNGRWSVNTRRNYRALRWPSAVHTMADCLRTTYKTLR